VTPRSQSLRFATSRPRLLSHVCDHYPLDVDDRSIALKDRTPPNF
jgi:hypothetical protein